MIAVRLGAHLTVSCTTLNRLASSASGVRLRVTRTICSPPDVPHATRDRQKGNPANTMQATAHILNRRAPIAIHSQRHKSRIVTATATLQPESTCPHGSISKKQDNTEASEKQAHHSAAKLPPAMLPELFGSQRELFRTVIDKNTDLNDKFVALASEFTQEAP